MKPGIVKYYILFFLFSFPVIITVCAQNNCINSLVIIGKTNINEFQFSQNSEIVPVGENHGNWRMEEKNKSFYLYIPVNNFKTNNPFLYFDFLDLLKAEKYPELIIKLEKDEFSNYHSETEIFAPNISIELAGVNNEYKVQCEYLNCNSAGFQFKGVKKIKLTDFKLVPPKKSFGLIKVSNDVFINFEFVLPFAYLSNINSYP